MLALGDVIRAELNGIEAKTRREQESKAATILNKWIPERRKAGRAYRDPAKRTG